jgi:hypothetical protein
MNGPTGFGQRFSYVVVISSGLPQIVMNFHGADMIALSNSFHVEGFP